MKPLLQCLALTALLLIGAETAWGQANAKPTIKLTQGSKFNVVLSTNQSRGSLRVAQPGRDTATVIGVGYAVVTPPGIPSAAYLTIKGSKEILRSVGAQFLFNGRDGTAGNAEIVKDGEAQWTIYFTKVGLHTFTLIVKNSDGESTVDFTVNVTWQGGGGSAAPPTPGPPNRRTNNIVVPGYRRINLRDPATWSSPSPSRLQQTLRQVQRVNLRAAGRLNGAAALGGGGGNGGAAGNNAGGNVAPTPAINPNPNVPPLVGN